MHSVQNSLDNSNFVKYTAPDCIFFKKIKNLDDAYVTH